jgi:DNA polymerase III epsilon subunit-like protein
LAGPLDIAALQVQLGGDQSILSNLRAWEDTVRQAYLDTVGPRNMDKAVVSRSLNMGDMLEKLAPAQRNRLIRGYGRAIGFDKALEAGMLPDMVIKDVTDTATGFARYSVDPRYIHGPESTILGSIYNSMNVTLRGLDAGPELADQYTLSRNIVSSDYLERIHNMSKQMRGSATGTTSRVLDQGKVVVFDVETGGLSLDSGVRQLSASTMQMGPGGLSAPVMGSHDLHFRTYPMSMGMMAEEGANPRTLLQALEPAGGYLNPRSFIGDEYIDGMMPFLRELEDAKHIVGHNVAFDISQTFTGLMKTSRYLEDKDGFGSYIDNLFESVNAEGKIVDTLRLAQSALPGLEPDELLKTVNNKYSSYSIENLLMKTNLSDLISNELGGQDKLLEMMTAKLHSSDVDTVLTGHLLKALDEGTLIAQDLPDTPFAAQLKATVVKSAAITPTTNIADISHIDKRMFKALLAEQDESAMYMDKLTTRLASEGISAQDLLDRGETDKLYEHALRLSRTVASEADIMPVSMNVKYMEQGMVLGRDLTAVPDIAAVRSTDNILESVGNWRNFTGQGLPHEGFLNKVGTLFKMGERPSEESFQELQEKLARNGVPFAHLSLEERWLGSAMAMAPAASESSDVWQALSESERHLVRAGEDLGVGRFKAIDQAYVTRNAANLSLPPEILKMAEQEGILAKTTLSTADDTFETAAMFDLNPYETASGRKAVNLNYMLREDIGGAGTVEQQAQRLRTFVIENIQTTRQLEVPGTEGRLFHTYFDPETITDLDELSKTFDNIADRGIAVGRLDGDPGRALFTAIESHAQGNIADQARMAMHVGLVEEKEGVLSVAGMHLDRFKGEAERVGYAANLRLVGERLNTMRGYIGHGENRGATTMLNAAAKGYDRTMVQKVMSAYDNIAEHGPKVALAGLIAGAGVYLYGKYRENEEFSEPLRPQPKGSAAPGYVDDSMINYGTNTIDPLATAGTIRNLEQNGRGHTRMGPNKYANLYGGR